MQQQPPRRATLADVAARAGVTKSVASRVINNRDTINVRPETRQRIIDAARELEYQPHAMARALAEARTRVVTMLMPDLSNPAYDRILQGALEAANHAQHILMLLEADESGVYPGFESLLRDGLSAGVLVGAFGEDVGPALERYRVPHVFVNRAVEGSSRNVVIDMESASATAVEHLAGLGHTRLAQVDGPTAISSSRSRILGFRDRATRLGLPAPQLAHGDFTEEAGAEAMRELLAGPQRPTGVFVGTLRQAMGVLSVLHEAGLRVPDQVSVLCADDAPPAAYTIPPLTTLQPPFRELGRAAVDALMAQIEGKTPRSATLPFPAALIDRGSTARADQDGR